jgi:hypothetical protein
MNKSRPANAAPAKERQPSKRGEATREGRALQPAPTGANRGSPAAPVMKEFAKTKAESTGRS